MPTPNRGRRLLRWVRVTVLVLLLAGVVLMTNIFDIIAQFVMEHGGLRAANTGKDGGHG